MSFSKDDTKKIGDALKIDWNKYDIDELSRGINVELEHGTKGDWNITQDDPTLTIKIALAHLDEIPNYYTLLDKMEKEGKSQSAVSEQVVNRVRTLIEKYKDK
jgi:hypothetical protein